ncbi:MAG: tetratricopeptide repeat protein [Verrucomicrobiota bacterium]
MKAAHSFLRVFLVALLAALTAPAQDEQNPAQLDPSDIYFQGWLALRDCEAALEKDNWQKANDHLNRAKRFFDTVSLYHPDWKPHLLVKKQNEIKAFRLKISPQLTALQQDAPPALFHSPSSSPPPSPSAELTPAQKAEASRLYHEIASLKKQLKQSQNLRNADVARLQRKISQLQTERDRLAASTLNTEIRQLRNRLDLVEQEKRTLASSLHERDQELAKAKQNLLALDSKEKLARQRANELNAMLDKEREVAASVIDGIRSQQKTLQKELTETKQLLLAERERSSRLESLLSEARSEIDSLTNERDRLLSERDHLSELLKLNQGDRTRKLIEQNMTLARDLRQAREQMQTLSNNADTTAEELTLAKRDLSMAKARIIELRKNNDSGQQRLRALESKLRDAYAELDDRANLAELDAEVREENRMLRGIIERQLLIQQRRRETRQMVLQAAREARQGDHDINQALEQLAGQELTLTPDEKLLIETQGASDGSFQFDADRVSPEQARRSGISLRRKVETLASVAEKSYRKGRLNLALELYDEILDEHPGHVPTMINQGVIRLRKGRNDDAIASFQDAIAMQGTTPIPYAHFMLGVTHHTKKDLDKARTEYELALRLEPNNAQAHNRLGVVHAQSGNLDKAKDCFQKAYRTDKNHLDALSNLSRAHNALGEKQEAVATYRKYRESGGSPKPDLEKLLADIKEKVEPEDPKPVSNVGIEVTE